MDFFDGKKEGDRAAQKPREWQLKGMGEKGAYPMKSAVRPWFLDQKRAPPVLRASRSQMPLAPAFSIAAHGGQGQTLPAAVIDLQIGRGVSSIASYAATPRIKTRHDHLIVRPLHREIFTEGAPAGPSLLLRKLRVERTDWEAVEAKHAPAAKCRGRAREPSREEGL